MIRSLVPLRRSRKRRTFLLKKIWKTGSLRVCRQLRTCDAFSYACEVRCVYVRMYGLWTYVADGKLSCRSPIFLFPMLVLSSSLAVLHATPFLRHVRSVFKEYVVHSYVVWQLEKRVQSMGQSEKLRRDETHDDLRRVAPRRVIT